MYYELEFKSGKSIKTLVKETKQYFISQGFKLIDERENHLIFKRGSQFRNMIAFNPLKWKSKTEIYFINNTVQAIFDINTIHQAVTKEEEYLWELFVANYRKHIETGHSNLINHKLELTKTRKSSLKYLGHAVLGAIIFGIPGGLISYFTKFDIILSLSAAAGALFFLRNKIDNEKNKNAT